MEGASHLARPRVPQVHLPLQQRPGVSIPGAGLGVFAEHGAGLHGEAGGAGEAAAASVGDLGVGEVGKDAHLEALDADVAEGEEPQVPRHRPV